jgi:protease IV
MTKSTKWFLSILALLAIAAVGFSFLVFVFLTGTSERTQMVTSGSGDKIALVQLQGVITSSDAVVRQLKKHREDKSIKAILLRIDSPGGGVVASQEMYEEVKKTRDSGKPVVASMGSLAASGGYYVACGASRTVANRGTLTGSIGVISEFLQLQEAMDKLGVSVKTIKSGKLKDAGSPTKKMTDEDQKYFQVLMDDVHGQFIRVVEKERKLSHEQVMTLADGRVFTGTKAAELGLVDTLGTLEDAIAITAQLAGIKGEPAIVRERKRQSFWETMFGDVAESISAVKQEILDRPVLSYRFVGP